MTAAGPTLRLAHRGDWRHAPENSVAAFVAAARLPGIDGIEFDVRASRDGVPVVIHDASAERVQGDSRRVRDLSATKLADIGVPTLAEVLQAIPRRTFLDVELKEVPDHGWVEVLAAGRGPELERAVVSSFELAALRRMQHLAPSWPRWLNAVALEESVFAAAIELGCAGIALEWHAIDQRVAARLAGSGLALAAWTVTQRATFARLARLGAAAICVEGAALLG